jgi:hypothetical protein
MSQLVKTKRQDNIKDFKRFRAFKGLVEQKNLVFNLFLCKLGSLWHEWASLKVQNVSETSVLKAHEPNLHTNSLNNILLPTKLLFF